MLSIPQEIKDLLHQDTCKKNIRIVFPNGERTDICNDLIVKDSVSFKESLCSQNSFKFGLAESSIFECETVGVGNIKGATIEVFCEVYCPQSVSGAVWQTDLQAWVYQIPYGRFEVNSCERQADMIHRKILCYTGMNTSGGGIINPVTSAIIRDGTSTNITYTPDLMKMALSNVPEGSNLNMTTEDMELTAASEETGLTLYSRYTVSTTFGSEVPKYRMEIICPAYKCPIGISGGIPQDTLVKVDQETSFTQEFVQFMKSLGDYCPAWSFNTISLFNSDVPYLDYYSFKNMLAYGLFYNVENSQQSLVANGYAMKNTEYSYPYGMNVNSSDPPFFEFFKNDSNGNIRVKIYERHWIDDITWVEREILDKSVPFKQSTKNITVKKTTPPISLYATFARKQVDVYGTYTSRYYPDMSSVDMSKLLNAALEILGKFMLYPRSGEPCIVDMKQKFNLLPSNTLYPSNSLKPLGVTGGSILPEDYQTCWYDDHYTLPYGAIGIYYKDSNNNDAEYIKYINGFSSFSDEETYQIYWITDNVIIQNRQSTSAEMQSVAALVEDSIANVIYMPVKFKGRGLPYVQPGDTFEILTKAGESITTIVLERTVKGEMTLVDEYVSVQ